MYMAVVVDVTSYVHEHAIWRHESNFFFHTALCHAALIGIYPPTQLEFLGLRVNHPSVLAHLLPAYGLSIRQTGMEVGQVFRIVNYQIVSRGPYRHLEKQAVFLMVGFISHAHIYIM